MLRSLSILLALQVAFLTAPSSATSDDDLSGVAALVQLLAQVDDLDFQLDLLKGMREGLKGRKQVPMPEGWSKLYTRLAKSPKEEVRNQAQFLALTFGDPQVLAALEKVMIDPQAPIKERTEALQALVDRRTKKLAPTLHRLVADPALRGAAIKGLAAYDHQATPLVLLKSYGRLSLTEKQLTVGTLASRPAYAMTLLDAVKKKQVARDDISAFIARQLASFENEKLTARLTQVWGAVRQTSKDKKALIARYKTMLTPKLLAKANLSNGRFLFSKTCMQCHTLYGQGKKIGPDLTGSNRANLHYVLENVLDPSAVIGKDYRLINVITEDGRLIAGLIREQTENAVIFATVNGEVVLSREDIDVMRPSTVSMMPEGQLDKMKKQDILDLVAYLATRDQVPLPKGKMP